MRQTPERDPRISMVIVVVGVGVGDAGGGLGARVVERGERREGGGRGIEEVG